MTPKRESSIRQQLVVVLGMHRSGTSAVTRALQSLGVELGSELLPSAPNNNEKGFWEDRDLVALNATLLGALGVEWDSLGAINQDALASREVGMLRDEARNLLLRKLGYSQRYGIKDPRLCRLLPFWVPVFQQLDLDVRYVIASRNPLSVAASLLRRDGMPVEKGLLLWLVYTEAAFRQAWPHKPMVLDYDCLLENPLDQLGRLADFLQVPVTERIESAVKAYSDGFLEDRLRHTVFGFDDVMATPGLPACAKKLFEILTQLGKRSDSIDTHCIQDVIRQTEDALTILEPALVCIDKTSRQQPPAVAGSDAEKPARNPNVTELLAYHAAEAEAYSEKRTVRAPVFFDAGRQTIYVALPVGTRSVRIDPSTRPCVFKIHAAVWRTSAYEAIQAEATPEIGILRTNDIVVRSAHGSEALQELICFGSDPNFSVDIPAAVAAVLDTQTVLLELDIETRSISESIPILTEDLLGGLAQQFDRTIQELESRVSRLVTSGPPDVVQQIQSVLQTCEGVGQDFSVRMEQTLAHLRGFEELLAHQAANLSGLVSTHEAFGEQLRNQAEKHCTALDELRERHDLAYQRQDAALAELREQHDDIAQRHDVALAGLSETVHTSEGRVMTALSDTNGGVRAEVVALGQTLIARQDSATSALEQVVTQSAAAFAERVTNECRAEVARSTEQTAQAVEKLNAELADRINEQTAAISRSASALEGQLARMQTELNEARLANKNLSLEREGLQHALETLREKLQDLQGRFAALNRTRGGRLLLRMYGLQSNISQEK